MGTIEEAAKRLEQLRRAGVVAGLPPELMTQPPAAAAPAAPPAPATPPAAEAQAPQLVSVPLSLKDAGSPVMPDHFAAPEHPATHDDSVIVINLPGLEEGLEQPEHEISIEGVGAHSRHVDVDLRAMIREGLLTPGTPRSQLEEEFRIVKRPLLENVRNPESIRPKRANLIMVTSAMPGEGKTQTSINLALSIAMELDHTVLLVEADVLRPTLLARMGVRADRGLLDLLDGSVQSIPDVLLKTNIPKLTLLPAGRSRNRATELLASTSMDTLLDELAGKYPDRVIVFDTPPLLSTTESRVLASNMGQVVMVVEASKTPINAVKQAFSALEDHPLVLTMLNKYQGPKGTQSYGYYAL
jgi:protein-tyrosine kinase